MMNLNSNSQGPGFGPGQSSQHSQAMAQAGHPGLAGAVGKPGMNPQEEQIAMVLQAVAQGQDLSSIDPKMLSAAKAYSVKKVNDLNQMVNSAELPPNVTREMIRNELSIYEGFANKMTEDDPQYADAMDAAFIGMGLYAGAKYGPMAWAKAKTMTGQAYGFGQTAAQSVSGLGGRAAAAGAATVGGITGAAEGMAANVGAAAGGVAQGVRDYGRGITDNLGANRLGSAPGMIQHNKPYAAGQKTFGFGKNLLSGIANLGRKALFRF